MDSSTIHRRHPVFARLETTATRSGKEKEMASISPQDLVQAAYQLLGAPYRRWFVGDPVPMWRKDGVGDPPPPWHLHNVGVMGSDLVNFVLERNGLPPGGGTVTFAH